MYFRNQESYQERCRREPNNPGSRRHRLRFFPREGRGLSLSYGSNTSVVDEVAPHAVGVDSNVFGSNESGICGPWIETDCENAVHSRDRGPHAGSGSKATLRRSTRYRNAISLFTQCSLSTLGWPGLATEAIGEYRSNSYFTSTPKMLARNALWPFTLAVIFLDSPLKICSKV